MGNYALGTYNYLPGIKR